MNDLSDICQKVWEAKDIETKKNLLTRAINTFKYKAKIPDMLKSLESMDINKLDIFASNLMLNKTDKVVDLLPR